jgi:hypothetical protein
MRGSMRGPFQGGTIMRRRASPEENALIQALGSDLDTALLEHAKAFVREVTVQSARRGLPAQHLPYVFWVLFEGYKNWPPMSAKDREMLNHALRVTMDMGMMPPYSAAFRVPNGEGPEVEVLTDEVVSYMAQWSRESLVVGLFKDWQKVLQKYASKVPKATRGEVSSTAAKSWLQEAFFSLLTLRPSWFRHPLLMLHIFSLFPR